MNSILLSLAIMTAFSVFMGYALSGPDEADEDPYGGQH